MGVQARGLDSGPARRRGLLDRFVVEPAGTLAHGVCAHSVRICGCEASLQVRRRCVHHAMWFHRPFRADDWLLYYQDTPFAGGARGLARGQVYTQSGELVVSVMQEGLIRVADA
nr:acyl-CoA thioesterase domain-containing protein [Spirillospora albida]